MTKVILIATMMYYSGDGEGFKTSTTQNLDSVEECRIVGEELLSSFKQTSFGSTGIDKGEIKCLVLKNGKLIKTENVFIEH